MRILSFIGGSGGIGYWISLYTNRFRAEVYNLETSVPCNDAPLTLRIRFGVENLGTKLTSLNPSVLMTELSLTNRKENLKRIKLNFHITEENRKLSPLEP